MFKDVFQGTKTDFLGLRSLLSQAWLCPALLCLIVYIVQLQLLKQSIGTAISLSYRIAANECATLHDISQKASQSPQEILNAMNRLIASSVNTALRNAEHTLSTIITIIESLIIFAFEFTVGTYACLTISAVNIAANEALNATESIVSLANKTAAEIGRELNHELGKLTKFVNSAIGLVNSVEDFITGGDASIKSVNLTSQKLDHLNISTNINDKLESLRGDIPTYDRTKAELKSIISLPFNKLKTEVGGMNYTLKLNISTSLALPEVRSCNLTEMSRLFHEAQKDAFNIIDGFTVGCGLMALIVAGIGLYKAHRSWRRIEALVDPTDPFKDPLVEAEGETMQRIENMSRIVTARSSWLERLFLKRVSVRHRWYFRYIFHNSLLNVLGLGMAGIGISVLELIILAVFTHSIHDAQVKTGQYLGSIETDVGRIYEGWRNSTNSKIAQIESQANQQLFGWVRNGSAVANSTLAKFMNSMNSEISDAFGKTPFEKPLQAAANCLIYGKVKEAEKALTWIHNQSRLDLPRIPAELHIANAANSKLGNMGNNAALAVEKIIGCVKYQILVQIMVSGIILGVWVAYALGAAIYMNRDECRKIVGGVSKKLPVGGEKAGRPHALQVSKTRGPESYRKNAAAPSTFSPLSPLDRVANRVTQLFMGPARKAEMGSSSPHRGSIHLADSPRTPLRAMMFK